MNNEKIQAKRKSNNQIIFRVNDKELEAIESKYIASGMKNKSRFYKKLILEGMLIKVNTKDIKDHTLAISRIGTNINQISAKLHSVNYQSKEDIEQIKSCMKEICTMENKLLSIFYELIKAE